ncbi:DUF982 domain-containing protein [Sinorhizobium sp. GL28]|uniref:DUF982 domain-containing protein n=1 Tax=Sinorhizobium sp. GL28 TaxID=1358418 RepID=UPI00071D7C11|nr:DUF982 domain-containing protein [Sinorhizobium sp. GL28]KSV83705.1 hypothetical protein N184_34470 [Sinorhizobium sp. GL28]
MLSPELLWMTPVTVQMKDGRQQVFSSVNDVLDFLEGNWTVYRGSKHNRAVQTCRRALNRMTPVAIARAAFIDACQDAGMSIASDGPLGNKPGAGGQHSRA